ncbi:helix-turn-helix domain-containing protein [Psychrobacillus sp. NEAU-3TGS]|uniref:helix-turn-helix domain-containing protein n=1 Tax=Psychrobacillus sp. NEAU-3TGS TaxID=2995412 RepID=UPI002499A212|nr:helix-turn-helix domain-containing protein [Psychrobacillus sp. NEAU-3TGS]MDI2587552.1 helix-turn-helix domain-containing protein [Psychrobacillus sp. NEAU-3TGS]
MKYLGLEISKLRAELGMSQKELANNICTQSTISRIEAGEVYPAIDTLLKIALKLQVPVEYFIEMLFHKNVLESEQLIKEIEYHLKEHNYKKVISIIKQNKTVSDNIWLNLYLEHILHTARYKLKIIGPEECILELKNILNFSNQTTIQFRFLHIKIYNTIANVYSETGEGKKSLYYYNKILKEHMHKNYTDHKVYETLITVLFNKCKVLYDLQDFDAALETANQGIQKSKETSYVFLVGKFLYYKAQCLEKKGTSFIEIKEVYNQALFFFEFLELPFYISAIKQNKQQYLD